MSRIKKYFIEVRAFVSRRFPELAKVKLFIGCPLIAKTRRISPEGYRAYMHVNHYIMVICVSPGTDKLSRRYIIGLFLHEFGHLIGGPEEYQADTAILKYFGIPITYKGSKELEYVRV